MYHGIINIYKEAGYTSHDVVAKMRGILGQKKIGHTGTLDPDAVGVLPVCLGAGTKLCDMLTDEDKEYVAELLLGVTTDTQDLSGTVLSRQEVSVDDEQAEAAIYHFRGAYEQVPPMYSALKVNGRKLYELAREGKEIERKARTVQIKEIEILTMQIPVIKIRVVCSKGTYIRTLCDDIGKELGCGAAMKSLQRTRVGQFTIKDAKTLAEIEKQLHGDSVEELILSVDDMFPDLQKVKTADNYRKQLVNGNCLALKMICTGTRPTDGEHVRVYDGQDVFYGIYRYEQGAETLYPVKMFIT